MNSEKTFSRFIIWASDYDENVGGIIALHALCYHLKELGYDATIWPGGDPRDNLVLKFVRKLIRLLTGRKFDFGPFANKLASKNDLRGAIVIYPEIVPGNPLGADQVVRWLLYWPKAEISATFDLEADKFANYMPAYADGLPSFVDKILLRVQHLNPAYYESDRERSGDCVLFRKGKDRKLKAHPAEAVIIDGLSHEETAELFRCRANLYSYDLYTMTNTFAAICGCTPIIIPDPNVSIDKWMPEEEQRWGLAYGTDQVNFASTTRPLLLARLAQAHADDLALISAFAERFAISRSHPSKPD